MNGRFSAQHTRAVADVLVELAKAAERFPAFNSPHEGWAVIREELEELWEHVRSNTGRYSARSEAIQVAAMALRYAADLCDVGASSHRCPQYAEHAEHEWGEWWCPGVKVAPAGGDPA